MNANDPQSVLRQAMADAGIATQAELAAAIGMSQGQVNRWLTGAANPPERRLRYVIEQLGLDPARYGMRVPPKRGMDDERVVAELRRIALHVEDMPEVATRLELIMQDLAAIRAHLGIERETGVT